MQISTKTRVCDWSTKREVKIRRLNTSINLHSDTALFTALFCIYWEMRTGEFQTLHLCENPLHAPANGNYIITLIPSVYWLSNIIFHRNMVFSIQRSLSIHGPTFLVFLSPSFTTCVGVAGTRLASSFRRRRVRVHGRGIKKPFPTMPYFDLLIPILRSSVCY